MNNFIKLNSSQEWYIDIDHILSIRLPYKDGRRYIMKIYFDCRSECICYSYYDMETADADYAIIVNKLVGVKKK